MPWFLSGAAACDVIHQWAARNHQLPEATAYLPPDRLLHIILPTPREPSFHLHPQPVCLPGLCRSGLRVSSRRPNARWPVTPQQSEWGLLLTGTAAKEQQLSPGRVSSRSVYQPSPPSAAAAAAAAAAAVSWAAFPSFHCCLSKKT